MRILVGIKLFTLMRNRLPKIMWSLILNLATDSFLDLWIRDPGSGILLNLELAWWWIWIISQSGSRPRFFMKKCFKNRVVDQHASALFSETGSGSVLEWKASLKSKFKAFEAQNRAIEGRGRSQWRPGGSKLSPGGSIDLWSQILITLRRSWIRIHT